MKKSIPSSHNGEQNSKRALAKSIAAVSAGAIVMPWTKPVVESIVLPSHASTSQPLALLEACVETNGNWRIEGLLATPAMCCADRSELDSVQIEIPRNPNHLVDLCNINPEDRPEESVVLCDESDSDITNVFGFND